MRAGAAVFFALAIIIPPARAGGRRRLREGGPLRRGSSRRLRRLRQGREDSLIHAGGRFHEAEVKGIPFFGDLFAGEGAPPGIVHFRPVFRGVGRFKGGEVFPREGMGLAEGGHVRAEVVVPDGPGISFVFSAAGEEEDVRLHARGVEDARGKAEDGVEVALVHEVAADLFSVAVGEEDIVRENDGGAGFPVGFQAPVDVLEEIQLFVAGLVGEVVPGGPFAAFFCAERRIGEDDVVVFHGFARLGEGVAEGDLPADAVEHGVHEGEAVGIPDELGAGEGVFDLKAGFCLIEGEEVVGV